MVTRNGRPDRLVTVKVYSSRMGETVAADVEVACDGCAAVVGTRFDDGGLPLDIDAALNADEQQQARDVAGEYVRESAEGR